MMDFKSMTTHMVMNLKHLSGSSSDLVDLMMYKQLIRSLMYLVNTRPVICFVESTLSQYLVEAKAIPFGYSEASFEVSKHVFWSCASRK